MRTRKQIILDTISCGVAHLMYYDRKEDPQLPRGAIEEAVAKGEVTVDEMIAEFGNELRNNLT